MKTKLIALLCIIAIFAGVATVGAVNYILGTSAPFTVTVNDTQQTITPTISGTQTITIGQSVTLTIDATANWPNKPVSLYEGSTLIGSATTNAAGVATISVTPATLGAHVYTAAP